MSGAARVYVTLDDITTMMDLPEGHYVLAVDDLPDGYIPGMALIIAHGDDVHPKLPTYNPTEPLLTMDLPSYRRWMRDPHRIVRTALRPVETGCADDCTHPSHQHHDVRAGRPGRRADDGYTPARSPANPADPATWLRVPGEPAHADPGDEDIHMGGPR